MPQMQTYYAGGKKKFSQAAKMGLPKMREGEIPGYKKGEKKIKIFLELEIMGE
jgi:hypothetical protein